MNLLMKNIHMCRTAKQTETQITLDEDLNVPDSKPDVEMIIQSREKIVLENIRTEKGKVCLEGHMDVAILYMDDTGEHRLHRLDTRILLEKTIYMEGLETGENVTIHYTTEDLNVTLINSRKLAIRALLSISAFTDEIYDLSAAADVQSDLLVCKKRKKLELMQLEVQKKDILRIREEISIPSNKPDIEEILWENTQLRECRIQLMENEILVQGRIFVFVLYHSQREEQSAQWMEQAIPFSGKIECAGAEETRVPDIKAALSQMELSAAEDSDGELRQFHLEGVVELDIRIYKTETTEILEDLYSPDKKLEPVVSCDQYEMLVMRNDSKCRASGKIRIQGAKPGILQICCVSGSVKLDQTRIVEDGIQIEGAVPVSILYISADDKMPFAVLEGVVPFSHVAQVPGIDENCRYSLRAGMEQLTATMSDSEEIEVKVTASLPLMVVRPCTQQCIHEVKEEEYSMEELEAVPGITGYIVQGTETLWEIAKEYFLTPQQVMEMNEMEEETLRKGDRLILMKSIRILEN